MRKNDLIKMLQGVEGNPEVMLWNGFVGDVVPIAKEVVPVPLVKATKESYVRAIWAENCVSKRDWDLPYPFGEELESLESCWRKSPWEMNQFVTEKDIKEKTWKQKYVYVLQPRITGKTYYDRLGGIDY